EGPAYNCQLPAAGYRPSAIGHRPSTISYRLSAVDHRPYNDSMRRAIVVAAVVFAGSCGGTPTVPSTPPPAGGGGLPAGAYTLTLNDTAVFACDNGICTSLFLCIGPSPAQPPTASIPVTLSRDGDRATLVPVASGDSLRATLQVGGSSV